MKFAIKELYSKNSDKFDRDFFRFISLVLNSDIPNLIFLMFVMKRLKARNYLRDKKIADSIKKKNKGGNTPMKRGAVYFTDLNLVIGANKVGSILVL